MAIAIAKVKLTVAKLIELAYSKDAGLTAKIIRSKGSFRLAVDTNGNATISGKAGILRFSGKPALESIGVALKRVNVNFSNEGEGRIRYLASFDILKSASISVAGSFDIEKLITSCSGLLCQAARLLKGANQTNEAQLQRVMGY